MRRLQKRKFNGIFFKKGERVELWARKPVMPREYFSGKYDKDDEVVSKQQSLEEVGMPQQPPSPFTFGRHSSDHSFSAGHAKLRQVQAQPSSGLGFRGSEIIEKV